MSIDPDVVSIIKNKFPEVKIHEDQNGKAYFEIRKAVYGSLQAGSLWYHEVSRTLKEAGYKACNYDCCLFYKREGDRFIIFVLYVDDIIVGSTCAEWITELKEILTRKYKKVEFNQGNSLEFLSMKLEFDDTAGTVDLSMPKHLQDIARYDIDDEQGIQDRKYDTPAPMSDHNTLFTIDPNDPPLDITRGDKFRTRVAKISYVMERTGCGGNIVICFLRSRVSKPTENDWARLIHLIKYIRKHPEHMQIRIGISGRLENGMFFPLTLYADASHQTTHNRKSIGGVIMTGGIGPLWHRSSIIKTPADSTAESEVMQLQHVAKTGLWAYRVLQDIGIPVKMTIFEDCQPAITLVRTHGMSTARRVKHIDAKCWWMDYYLDNDTFQLEYLDTKRMIADQYTKLLTPSAAYAKAICIASGTGGYKISHIDNIYDGENDIDVSKK